MKKIYIISLLSFLISATSVSAEISSSINKLDDDFIKCSDEFTKQSTTCPETWSMKCYNFLIDLHHKTRDCYKDVGEIIITEYYNLSDREARERLNQYDNYMYDNYLFVYNETNYCRKNNCGVSPYLYSEYATTEALKNYISTIIRSILARN